MKYITTLILSLLLFGCSTSYRSNTQIDGSAFIQLSGQIWGTQLQIDDLTPVDISQGEIESFISNNTEVVKFPINTGSHRVLVKRAGKVVVDRKIYLSNSNTFEIKIP